MREKIKFVLQLIVCTNIGRFLLAFSLLVLGFILQDSSNNIVSTIGFFLIGASGAFLAVFMLVALTFAWIINPLRDRK